MWKPIPSDVDSSSDYQGILAVKTNGGDVLVTWQDNTQTEEYSPTASALGAWKQAQRAVWVTPHMRPVRGNEYWHEE